MKHSVQKCVVWLMLLPCCLIGQGAPLSMGPNSPTASVSENTLRLDWLSSAEVSYQFDQSTNLSKPKWLPLLDESGIPLTRLGNGRRQQITFPIQQDQARFFRIRPVRQSGLHRLSATPALPTIPLLGLIAHWPLDGTDSVIAPDLISPVANGSFSISPTWIQPAALNGGINLASNPNPIQIPDPGSSWKLDLSGPFTLLTWVLPQALDQAPQAIFSKDNVIEFELGQAGLGSYSARLNNVRQGAGNTTLEPGEWTHLGIRWDGNQVTYFINGEPDGSHSFQGPLNENNTTTGLAGRPPSTNPLHGGLDDVRLYSRALTHSEVSAVYHWPQSPESESRLAAYWAFDTISNCETPELIQDLTTTLNPDCDPNGPIPIEGVDRAALNFDGSDDGARATNSPRLSSMDHFTTTAWVRMAPSSGWRPLVDHRDAGSDGWDLYLDPSSRLFLRVNTETTSGSTALPNDEWAFVAGTYDGTEAKLYLNGILESVEAFSTAPLNINAPLNIGQHFNQSNLRFKGSLDELRIYDEALSQTELLELYQDTKPAPSSFQLTIHGGSGSGDVEVGEVRTINANPPADREMFDQWIGDIAFLDNPSLPIATLTMPAMEMSLTATYRERDPDLADALRAYWTFDENSGCTTADQITSQLSPLGPDCPNNAPLWVFGLEASGLQFDATEDQVQIDLQDRPDLAQWDSLTVSAWIKPSATSQGWRPIVDSRDNDSDGFDLYLDLASRPFLRINQHTLTGTLSASPSGWSHIVGSFDGDTLRLYVNGALAATKDIAQTSIEVASSLILGRHYQRTDMALDGSMEELRLYGRALTDTEVALLHSQHEFSVPETFHLTIQNGTGSGEFLPNTLVAISANEAPLGFQFTHWSGATTDLLDPNLPTTAATIRSMDITLKANYEPLPPEYYLSVQSGSGDGLYPEDALVSIQASDRSSEGLLFSHWSGDIAGLQSDSHEASNLFSIPASEAVLVAEYSDDPDSHALRIINGMRGTGVYQAGQTVTVMAANPPHAKQFAGWSGTVEDLALLDDPTRYWTTLNMPSPGRDITLSALYETDPLHAGNPKGYQPRPNSLDLDRDGQLGEPGGIPGESDDLIPGGIPSDYDFANMIHDIDGDNIDEDLIYVDAERGSDMTGTGTPAHPYRTLRHALAQCDGANSAEGNGEDIVIFHGTFYAVELDEAFRRIDIQDRLIIPHGGEPGAYKLSNEHSTEVPSNPFRLMGWDYDNDGIYPPMDTDDIAILHGNNYRGERAISNHDGAHSYWELAHFTIEEFAGDPHPDSGESAPNLTRGGIHLGRSGVGTISHIYIHDIEMRNILNNWETPFIPGGAEGHGITFFSGAATLHHITIDNLFVNGFAGFFGRGAPGVGDAPSGPYRFENMTLKHLRSSQRPGTDSQAIATGFKIWNWTRDVTLKDCLFDGQPDMWHDYGRYHPSGWLIRPGMQDVKIVGNEFYDMHTATGAVGDLTTDPGAAQNNILIDSNRFIVTFKQWTVTAQPHAKISFYLNRGDDNTVKTTGNFRIVNNMFYLDGGRNMVALWLDGGNAVGPQNGHIVIAGNTFFGPGAANNNAYAIRTIGTRTYRYDDYVIKNNLFLNWGPDVGGGSGGKHIFFGDRPSNVISDGNVFAPESGFGWGDRRQATLADWQEETGQDLNSHVGQASLINLSPNDLQSIDLHVSPSDAYLAGKGVNISDWTGSDFDGHPRTGIGPFWPGADVRDGWDTRPLFSLVVPNGTGGGRYPAGTIATLIPEAPGYGLEFSHWTGDTEALVTPAQTREATVLIPEANISLSAVTIPAPTFNLSVNRGSGDGVFFIEHDRPTISAEAQTPNQVFSHWTGDTQFIDDLNARTTSLFVPRGSAITSIKVEAVFTTAPTAALTINEGNGTGHYGLGEIVSISARQVDQGDTFFWWQGDTQHLIQSPNSAVNSLSMPTIDLVLSAYIDRNATTAQFVETEANSAGEFLWNDSSNWQNTSIPRIMDIVEIGNDGTPPFQATLRGDGFCHTLEIAEGPKTTSGSRLRIQAGSLTIATVLNVGKDLSGHFEMFDGALTLNRGQFKVGAHWPNQESSTAIIHGGTIDILDARLVIGGDAANRASSIGSRFELLGGTLFTHDGIRVNSKLAEHPAILRIGGSATLNMERFAVEIFNGRFEVDGGQANLHLANLHLEGSQEAADPGTGQVLVQSAPATLAFSGDQISTIHVDGNVIFREQTRLDIDHLNSELPIGSYTLINGTTLIDEGISLTEGTDLNQWTIEIDTLNGNLLLHKHSL